VGLAFGSPPWPRWGHHLANEDLFVGTPGVSSRMGQPANAGAVEPEYDLGIGSRAIQGLVGGVSQGPFGLSDSCVRIMR
jgi:hypothetical protein